jgi:hypothetical protein
MIIGILMIAFPWTFSTCTFAVPTTTPGSFRIMIVTRRSRSFLVLVILLVMTVGVLGCIIVGGGTLLFILWFRLWSCLLGGGRWTGGFFGSAAAPRFATTTAPAPTVTWAPTATGSAARTRAATTVTVTATV